MYSLYQSIRASAHAGEPIATVFPSLAHKGAHFVRGQLVLLASSPGTGKSAFALTVALRSAATTMYYSADSDDVTQVARAYAISQRCSMSAGIKVARSQNWDSLEKAFKDTPIQLDYSASPTPVGITRALHAYHERYGEYPELIILDNVLDVAMEAGESESMSETSDALMAFLHQLARDTGACVLGLHHVTGTYNDGQKVVPLSGIKGQIGRVPEVVLTLSEGPGAIRVSVVKNRNGWHDKTGEQCIELDFEPERMRFTDPHAHAN